MCRLSLFVFTLFAVGSAFGQGSKEPPPEESIYRIKAKPAAAPLPSLKYELIPSALDQTANNAALLYYRALIMAAELRGREANFGKLQQEVMDGFDKPLKDIPKDLFRKYVSLYTSVLKETEAATRCNQCDWGTMQRIQEEGIALLIPEIQQLREIANALRVRSR